MKTIKISNKEELEKYKDKYGYKIPWNAIFTYSADFKGRLEVEWYLCIEKECSMVTGRFIEVGGFIKAGGYLEDWRYIKEKIIIKTKWKKIKEVKPSKFK